MLLGWVLTVTTALEDLRDGVAQRVTRHSHAVLVREAGHHCVQLCLAGGDLITSKQFANLIRLEVQQRMNYYKTYTNEL